jgi:hypothetical protein
VVERGFCKADVASSNLVGGSEFYKTPMSLISQRDREVAAEALDFYLFNKGTDFSEEKRMEVNALLNWIKLEITKNEN